MNPTTTMVRRLNKLYPVNETGSSITAPAPTTTKPTAGIIAAINDPDSTYAAGYGANQFLFHFYAIGADNVTGKARINAWRKVKGGSLWIPSPLIEVDLTFSTALGVNGSDVLGTERFADTIVLTSGKNYTTSYEIIQSGTADNTPAALVLNVKGAELVQALLSVGTATSINGLATEL